MGKEYHEIINTEYISILGISDNAIDEFYKKNLLIGNHMVFVLVHSKKIFMLYILFSFTRQFKYLI